jgi:predicted GNAT superfamily acetyltransferase
VSARLSIREAVTLGDLVAMHDVFAAQWGPDGVPQVNVFRAVQHAGGYTSVAEEDGRVIGGSLGFLGRSRAGEPLLHSHITGAVPGATGRGVGFALKQHQRSWCLDHGVEVVEWTFDPLVRRNAYFNLTKLGAVGTEYHADFYGPMDDAINAGDETDRLVATWRLRDERRPPGDLDRAPLVLDVGPDGAPEVLASSADTLRVRIPPDVTTHRHAWRVAVRETLGAAMQDGRVATGMTRDGCYVVSR